MRTVVEIVAVKLVHDHADGAGRDERIEVELRIVEKPVHARHCLVREVAAYHAGIGCGIVRLADLRQQQKLHVEQRESRQDHQIGGLFPFHAAAIHEGDAGGALAGAVGIDLGDFRIVARGEIRFAHQHRQDRGLRAGLGIVGAAEPLAIAAIGARPHPHAKRIGIGLRQIPRGLRERFVAEFARRLAEQRVAEALLLRRRRIRPRARAFERVAALLNLALQVPGLTRRAAQVFKRVVCGSRSS